MEQQLTTSDISTTARWTWWHDQRAGLTWGTRTPPSTVAVPHYSQVRQRSSSLLTAMTRISCHSYMTKYIYFLEQEQLILQEQITSAFKGLGAAFQPWGRLWFCPSGSQHPAAPPCRSALKPPGSPPCGRAQCHSPGYGSGPQRHQNDGGWGSLPGGCGLSPSYPSTAAACSTALYQTSVRNKINMSGDKANT